MHFLTLQIPRDPPMEGGRGKHRRAHQITFIVNWAVCSWWANMRQFDGRWGWDKDTLSFKRWRSHRQPPITVAMLGNGWLLGPLVSRSSSATTNQWQHHLENVYVSQQLGLILTDLSPIFWISFSECLKLCKYIPRMLPSFRRTTTSRVTIETDPANRFPTGSQLITAASSFVGLLHGPPFLCAIIDVWLFVLVFPPHQKLCSRHLKKTTQHTSQHHRQE